MIEGVYQRTKTLLNEKREGLEKLAAKLLEKEVLFQSDLEELLGKRPFDERTTYDKFVNGEAALNPETDNNAIPEAVTNPETARIDDIQSSKG
jgi:AFG3 family protein